MINQQVDKPVDAPKRERLDMRVDVSTKALAERAAAALGTTTTDLIVRLIRDHAPEILERSYQISMTNKQFDDFVRLTEEETPISQRLHEAASRAVRKTSK